ncbi:MAG TPA: DUF86 domain-containing protein [Spirochaetota bacterium]|nr:DUF86 domain-containing protein [Spirochaetota bacterium]
MPIEPDDVILNKGAIIERSLRRMMEEFHADPELKNFTHIDAMILNIERTCRAAIDCAMHAVSIHHAGIPQNSADAFILLKKASLLTDLTVKSMIGMTGFRNVAIHEYQDLEMNVLRNIVEKEWKSLVNFCSEMGVSIKVNNI